MDVPPVQFCRSKDGTSIAYTVEGEGPPLLVMLAWATNMELDWGDPECRLWLEQLTSLRLLTYCGRRGIGASQRDVTDLSLEAQVGDLSAVADRLGAEPFDIFASYEAGAVASSYAAQFPERVRRLILWSPFARGTDIATNDALTSLVQLMRTNWPFARRAWAELCFPSDPTGRGKWFTDLIRQSVDPETAAGYMEFIRDLDVRSVLPDVQTPALVLTRTANRYVPVSATQSAAALLPNARLVSLEGDVGHPPLGDISYLEKVAEFLGDTPAKAAERSRSAARGDGTAIILFADIADSTSLTERLGDAAFRERARRLDDSLRRAITGNRGAAIEGKLLGDGVLATFSAAREAIAAASAMHAAANDVTLLLHVGIHAGDVIRERAPGGRDDIYGGAVNIAARVASEAAAGETLVSATVRDLARTSASVSFEDRGERQLKGVSEPVRVFAVREQVP